MCMNLEYLSCAVNPHLSEHSIIQKYSLVNPVFLDMSLPLWLKAVTKLRCLPVQWNPASEKDVSLLWNIHHWFLQAFVMYCRCTELALIGCRNMLGTWLQVAWESVTALNYVVCLGITYLYVDALTSCKRHLFPQLFSQLLPCMVAEDEGFIYQHPKILAILNYAVYYFFCL